MQNRIIQWNRRGLKANYEETLLLLKDYEPAALCLQETHLKDTDTISIRNSGWSGGAMVLGKLPVPGRPTYLDYSRARAYCACRRCGWGLCGHFYSHLSFLSSVSLSLGDGPI